MSADTERLIELRQRYESLLHAVQSGVSWEMTLEGVDDEPHHKTLASTSRKHLRTGINAAMSDTAAIASLLLKKGVFTEIEYYEELVDFMGREVKRYEKELSLKTGAAIKLI